MLPSSVPSHTKCFVDQAARAVKTAWLIESQRANYTGEEISDEQLNKTYRQGRRWYSRHTTTPEVGMSCPSLAASSNIFPYSPRLSPSRLADEN